jgi:Protein of unknown function (DUF3443)
MIRQPSRGAALLLLVAAVVAGCGGSGMSDTGSAAVVAPAANVQPVIVGAGPTGQFVNVVLTSVTICVPGTASCQTIDNVQVDTGSSGLRLLASAVTIALPAIAAPGGGTYSECAGFADGVVWGPVVLADVKQAGESAGSVPVQLIHDSAAPPAVPASCSAQGAPEDTLAQLGANGILGIGSFLQDCGSFCATNADTVYYACSAAGSCAPATIPTARQVANPAAMFASDNNGVILQLPAIAAAGATSVNGNLIFGIGTQANNALTAPVIAVPDSGPTAGSFQAVYRGTTLPNGFFDSGSTGIYFDDSSIAQCPSNSAAGDLSGLYCPGPATALSSLPVAVTIMGSNGVSAALTLTVANALFLFTQPGAAALGAFDDLGGTTGATLPNAFDFGVPFFFGRSVFTAFEQRTTPAGSGPYFASQTP